jgi:hypothetical protein
METQGTVQQGFFSNVRIKWGAIFAGLSVGLATQIVFTLLGLAIGAWTLNLQAADPAQGVPIVTAIWAVISALVSAFVGGYVAARMSGVYFRSDGIFHGAVVWGLNLALFAWLTTTAMASMIGGIFNIFGAGLQAVGQGVGTVVGQVVEGTTGISIEELQQRIQAAVAEDPSPQVLAQLQQMLTLGDREGAVNLLVNPLGMSQAQAEQTVNELMAGAQELQQQATQVADTTLNQIGAAAGWLFVLSLLSLGASLFGGAIGVTKASIVEVEGGAFRIERRRAA